MKSMHKAMRLSHHKHTGKIIHHQHTSYGLLIFLMMIPVLVLVFIGTSVLADQTIQVNASVSAAPPPFPPTITSPRDGQSIAGAVTVRGGCPLAATPVYISIYEGQNVVGTTQCDNATGTYSTPISIAYGTHTIYAQVITFTDTFGLASSPVTFNNYFTVATSGGSGSIGGISKGQANLPITSNPLLFISGQGVVPFGPQMDAVWRGTINGGTAPYKVHVAWGDGSSNDYTIFSQTEQTFDHHYSKLGSYTMIFTVTDSAGQTVSLRVIAASALPVVAPLTADNTQTPTWYWRFVTSDIVKAYGSVFLGIITIWFFKRRHDRKEDERHGPQTPRHPYRPAHI